MPVAACKPCDRVYTIDSESNPQGRCPWCHRPLKRLSTKEALRGIASRETDGKVVRAERTGGGVPGDDPPEIPRSPATASAPVVKESRR
jgi:hypothetical protein